MSTPSRPYQRRGSPAYPAPTRRAVEMLRYIFDYASENGYQPTLREVACNFGLSSPTSVLRHLYALQGHGYVELGPKGHRGIRFIKTPDGEPFRGFIHKPIEAPSPGA